jgi:hypothetical protein
MVLWASVVACDEVEQSSKLTPRQAGLLRLQDQYTTSLVVVKVVVGVIRNLQRFGCNA